MEMFFYAWYYISSHRRGPLTLFVSKPSGEAENERERYIRPPTARFDKIVFYANIEHHAQDTGKRVWHGLMDAKAQEKRSGFSTASSWMRRHRKKGKDHGGKEEKKERRKV